MSRFKMFRSMSLYLVASGIVACGVDQGKFQAALESAQASQEDSADENLVGIELTEADEASQQVQSELSEEEKLWLSKIEELVRSLGVSVADCAGISPALEDFKSKIAELEASGKSRSEIKQELRSEHEAVRKLMKESREKFRECRDNAKQSELGQSVKTVVQACFAKPDRPIEMKGHGRGRRGDGPGFGPHKGGKGGRGHGPKQGPDEPKGMRLPPLEFQKLSDAACVAAVEGISEEEPVEAATSAEQVN
jgi:hypothetical protein